MTHTKITDQRFGEKEMSEKMTKTLVQMIESEANLAKGLESLRQAIAEMSCPFKVGDVVVRERDEKAEVLRIYYDYDLFGKKYRFDVVRLKKNGEQYKDSMKTWNFEKWVLFEEE